MSHVTPQNEWVTSIHNRLIVRCWECILSHNRGRRDSASYYESIVNWSDSFILRSDVTHSGRDSECILSVLLWVDCELKWLTSYYESCHHLKCHHSFWNVTWRVLNSEINYSCHLIVIHLLWVMSPLRLSGDMSKSFHYSACDELLWVMSPLISLFGMRHVTFQSESCDTSDLVMSHFKMSHAIIQTESCHSVECIMSPFRMSRVTIQNASCLPFRISHVTLQKKSCHPSEWVT